MSKTRKGKGRRSVSSHKMLADRGVIDNGKQTQDNSIGPCVKHFFSCEEGAGTSNMLDIVGSTSIGPPGFSGAVLSDGFDTSLVRRLYSGSGTGGLNGTFYQPGSEDTIIIICARSIEDTAHGDALRNGFISFYMGNGNGMRVQPYYCSLDNAAGDSIGTPFSFKYGTRTAGVDYMFAGAKAGRELIHWADGFETGRASIDEQLNGSDRYADLKPFWDDFLPSSTTRFTHSAYAADVALCVDGIADPYPIPETGCESLGFGPDGYIRPSGATEILGAFWPYAVTGNRAIVAEWEQDHYGILICSFKDGLPNDVPEALTWMKEQWLIGNKLIWPGWSALD